MRNDEIGTQCSYKAISWQLGTGGLLIDYTASSLVLQTGGYTNRDILKQLSFLQGMIRLNVV